jgi:hypothetical protein
MPLSLFALIVLSTWALLGAVYLLVMVRVRKASRLWQAEMRQKGFVPIQGTPGSWTRRERLDIHDALARKEAR